MRILLIWLSVLICLGAAPVRGEDFDLGARIKAAAPGEVIEVPAGVYRGNFALKNNVILEGEGAASTVLDGGGSGPVILAAAGSVIKGFTITNGLEGIKTSGGLVGIFENVIRGNRGSGICLGSSEGVVVNNLICGNGGKGGIEVARSCVFASHNTVAGEKFGIAFWKSPRSGIINNIIVRSGVGIFLEEDSHPRVENNIFWSNRLDVEGGELEGENFFLDPLFIAPEEGDFRLRVDSPVKGMVAAGLGLPEEITGTIGSDLDLCLPLSVYRKLLEEVRAEWLRFQPVVIYEPLDESGSFRVTTRFPRPEFTVTSSSNSTAIEEIETYDSGSAGSLIDRLVPDEPPAVEVRGWGAESYPVEKDRYVMESVFRRPDSCFGDEEGKLHFIRRTNFARVRIHIPEGYEVKNISPPGEIDQENRLISILNPENDLLEINLVLTPGAV